MSNNLTIAVNVLLLEVAEKSATMTYHLEKTATRVMILLVNFKMFGKVNDTIGEDSNLDFW